MTKDGTIFMNVALNLCICLHLLTAVIWLLMRLPPEMYPAVLNVVLLLADFVLVYWFNFICLLFLLGGAGASTLPRPHPHIS